MKWFKHDTAANMDGKLQEILLDYGLEGYGLYWYCLELISGKVSKENITFQLEHDARIIARNTGSTTHKVQEMMERFISLGLFENDGGRVTCLKLAKRIDQSMTSNPDMRKIIAMVGNNHDFSANNHDFSANSHDVVMTQSGKPMQDKNRLDKNRLNTKRDVTADAVTVLDNKEKSSVKRFKKPTLAEIAAYMAERDWTDSGQQSARFLDYYEANGWRVGKSPMKCWKAAVRNWERNNTKKGNGFHAIDNKNYGQSGLI